jgi:3-methyladenine DNA glycosylase AlkD
MNRVQEIEDQLKAVATEERAVFEKKYLKSELRFLGAPVPACRKAAKVFWKANKEIGRQDLLEFFDEMWQTDTHELRTVSIAVLSHLVDRLGSQDLPWLRDRIEDAAGWAHVDWLAADIVGEILRAEPDQYVLMDAWAEDECFWVRRAAMLSMLRPLREGSLEQWPRFTRYASEMVDEKEFFIRKTIGWVIRETSKKHPEVAAGYLLEISKNASGLTLREGMKHLQADVQAQIKAR